MTQHGCVEGPVKAILRLEGLAALLALLAAYAWLHAKWWIFVLALLVPDIAMLGYLRGTRIGAWSYNAFHSYVAPIAITVASIFVHGLLPIAIVWSAHIAMDRTLGYGLKYGDAFGHTHLGTIGRK
jgi:hypothetical protein